jgi:hypothetical protein
MNKTIALFAVALLSACASQERATTQDTEQAVRDFIDVRELAETDDMRTSNRDRWDAIDQNFIIYEANKETYLIEFVRRCHELDELPVVPDSRHSGNLVRARFDTLRGCRIAKMFPLTEGEVAELKAIGESPGSRN